MADEHAAERALDPGTRVEVRDGFEGQWNRGFEVTEATSAGYRVRRSSDQTVLPALLPRASVRRERRNSMWWM